ncbi:MAG: hypothetical protein JRN20_16010 [Nitrososphaerota archaeon]|nr:hypothetical protein [Nitrososphaerota archaeon]
MREGSIQKIEIKTVEGRLLNGSYKVNEFNWKKESGDYELLFKVGLQKISVFT